MPDMLILDYAIASSLPFLILNYILVGWYVNTLDHFYIESWRVFLSVVVVFTGLSNLALAFMRYRLGQQAFIPAVLENYRWAPMFCIFFGGLSFHLCRALLGHAFSINMEWGATAKEAEDSNFFLQLPKIFKRFKWMYLVIVPCIGGMIYLGCFAPHGWRITRSITVAPLAINLISHALFPVRYALSTD
jgi:hypothetical protein